MLKLMLLIKHSQLVLDNPVLTPNTLVWVPGHGSINNLMTLKNGAHHELQTKGSHFELAPCSVLL